MTAIRMVETTISGIRLAGGIELPQLGFNPLYLLPDDTQELVEVALETGYRHIDIATGRDNEEGVGAALAAFGLPREDYFVAVKLDGASADRGPTLDAFEAILDRLGLDHVDLLLLERPGSDEFVEVWGAVEEVHREEAARTIGVANFRIEDLARLKGEADTQPAVNQVELHPWLQEAELRAWHAEHGIVTEAWSPLAQGVLFDDETVVRIAESHGRTPAQAVMRWHMQLGNVAVPKLVTPQLIRELVEAFDFELSEDEMATIGSMDRGTRIGPDTAEMALP